MNEFIIHGVPTMAKAMQPWKNDDDPTSEPKPEVLKELIEDLTGCIMGYWKKYKINGYSINDALSDAYQGMLKAIQKDKSAPKITKNIPCPQCFNSFLPYCPGDERADMIYNLAPKNRIPNRRNIKITCPNCQHTWNNTIYKTMFSTHVNPYIRGEIQSGVRKHKQQHLSLDGGNGDGDYSLHQIIGQELEDSKDDLPKEILNTIYNIINDFHERDKETVVLYFGIGGVSDKIIKREIKCKHCNNEYETIIDYSLSHNFSECPNCGIESKVDMRINQTNIANMYDVSKQRMGSVIKKIKEKFIIELAPLITKYDIQF